MKKKIPCRVLDTAFSHEPPGEPSCRDSCEVDAIIKIFLEILSGASRGAGNEPVIYVKRPHWLEILPERMSQGGILDFRF